MNFSSHITDWYQSQKRDLPWRKTQAPYKIWLSEIILQQTRVVQGLSYYKAFLQAYPTVQDLARASEDEVLRLWQGLGYYSRARNLHETARNIVDNYGGQFPSNYKDLLKLKGVGKYTAAAIASFSFGEPVAVVDGNVQRVLSRVLGIHIPIDTTEGSKLFHKKANELIDPADPATHNQAMMEFGATHCVPRNPDCENCPFRDVCHAFQQGIIDALPIKAKKTKTTDRYFNYLYIVDKGETFLNKRTGKGIWQNLYEFPLVETPKKVSWKELIKCSDFPVENGINGVELEEVSGEIRHTLTHQRIHAVFWRVSLKNEPEIPHPYFRVRLNELDGFAFPKLIENYINSVSLGYSESNTLF